MNALTQFLINILYKDTTTLRLSLSLSALSLSFGFIFGSSDTPYYYFLEHLMEFSQWAMIFGLYGGMLLVSSFYKLHRAILCSIDAIGLWLWVYIFISFVIVNPIHNPSAAYMLIVPVMSALWLISDRLFKAYIFNQIFSDHA